MRSTLLACYLVLFLQLRGSTTRIACLVPDFTLPPVLMSIITMGCPDLDSSTQLLSSMTRSPIWALDLTPLNLTVAVSIVATVDIVTAATEEVGDDWKDFLGQGRLVVEFCGNILRGFV